MRNVSSVQYANRQNNLVHFLWRTNMSLLFGYLEKNLERIFQLSCEIGLERDDL